MAKASSAPTRVSKSRKYVGVSSTSGGYSTHAAHAGVHATAGTWPTARLAAIARDRLVLYFGSDRALNLPKEARALGPASAPALRRAARLLAKSSGAPRYFGIVQLANRKAIGASVRIDGMSVNLGYYDDARLAAEVHDRVAAYLWRLDPSRRDLLNFPDKPLSPMSPAAARAFARQLRKHTKTSRYRGVSREPRKLARRWVMHCVAGDAIGEGALRYRTEREAAIAYDRAMLHYEGRSALLNFPRLVATLVPADIATLRSECLRERKATTRSRFVGVCQARSGRWTAALYRAGVREFLGTFDTEEEAAEAYDEAALRLARGRGRVRLNFHPTTGEELGGQWVELA